MSNPILVNNLHYEAKPRLIFTANTPDRKGLSNKSYTIRVANDDHNNAMLGNLFNSGTIKPVKFEALYVVEDVTLTGFIVVQSIAETYADLIFISGAVNLWDEMALVNMTDIDMSDEDIVLNKTNVIASESGSPFVKFDLTDRGAFSDNDSIDIAERYPALNLQQLLLKVFSHFGVFLKVNENIGNPSQYYLPFTQDDQIRNSDEWKQSALFKTSEETLQYQENTLPAGSFNWTEQINITEEYDNGGNYASGVYTVPETGTYRTKLDIGTFSVQFEDDQGAPASISYASVANRARVTFEIRRNGSLLYRYRNIETVVAGQIELSDIVVDTKLMELTAGDNITALIQIEGTAAYTIGTQSRFTQNITDIAFYNETSRWYGAGSTIEISNILPQMRVSDFVRDVVQSLNVDVYYNEINNLVTLDFGKKFEQGETLTGFDFVSDVEQKQNTLLEQATDKAAAQPNYYIDLYASDTATKRIPFSRTYVGACYRLFNNVTTKIPVLWQSGDPTKFDQALTPPERKTRGALRILVQQPSTSGNYTLTYGGDTSQNSDTITSITQFADVNLRTLHIYDAALTREIVRFKCYLDLNKLLDLSYFMKRIAVNNRKGESIFVGWMLEAEQIDGNYYNVTAYTDSLHDINTAETTKQTADSNAYTGAAGGGGTTVEATPLPTDVWRTSEAGQISGLTSKTTPVDADNIVIDDSAASNAKKRLTWANIKATLKSYFDTIYFGTIRDQFNGVTSKTNIIPNDIFIIEDSSDLYKKKSTKFENISDSLSSYFYGTAASNQINATTAKTTPVDADKLLIEDSAATYAKKSLSWANIKATLKTYFDTIYNLWTADTHGITTNSNVGVGTNSSNVAAKVVVLTNSHGYSIYGQNNNESLSGGIYGGTASTSTSSSGVRGFATDGNGVFGSSTDGHGVYGSSTDGNGGNFLSTTGLGAYCSSTNGVGVNGTSSTSYGVLGTSVSSYGGYFTSSTGIGLYADNLELDSTGAIYLGGSTTDGSWRIIRSGNNLLMQRRESGTWVTKQTISA